MPVPWGVRRTLMGVAFAITAFVVTNIVFAVLIIVVGSEPMLRDVGDAFAKADSVAKYADQRLVAATNGQPLPKPPRILADLHTLELGFATTLFYETMLIAIVGGTSGRDLRGLATLLGLNRIPLERIWVPLVCVAGVYALVVVYAVVVKGLGIGFLEPQSTIPSAVAREPAALALAGVLAVIAAPLSEELFFRGLIFGGFLRWGFWPAALISGLAFSLAHFDPGSVIPFTGVGIIMAWLYWRRGCLWDSIIFHACFNFASFLLLASG